MRKNISNIRKIGAIILGFLIVYSFIPKEGFAASLILPGDFKGTIETNKSLPIVVKTSDTKSGVLIKFQSIDPDVIFSPYQCITSSNGSYSVSFSSPKICVFNVAIFDQGYITNSTVPIRVTENKDQVSSNVNYVLLQSLPCDTGPDCFKNFDTGNDKALGTYLNIMIKLCIGIAAVLAMIMIVMGGIEYMTSELMSHKQEGRERVTNAIL